ncbi:MAG: MATE family efflux transporter [Bacillota bacterium]|nr:MATE family efflux transporter [Bacillota bacterium]
MENENRIVKESINRLILTLAMPAILGQVLDIAYNLIDGIFIGRWVGTDGLAAIGLTFPLTLINMAVSIMIGTGTSTAIGRHIGRKDRSACNNLFSAGLILTVVINLVLSLIVIGAGGRVLSLMGADPSLSAYAMQYIRIAALGFVFMGIAMLMSDVLRNEGIIKPSIIVMLIGLVGNVVFDVLFIYLFGMGMAGAALATLTAQFLAAAYIIIYYFAKKPSMKFSLGGFGLKYCREIVGGGCGVLLRELVEAGVLIVLNGAILTYGGSINLAAFNIINKLIMMVYMPIGGFAEGLQPIISVNYGAEKTKRLKEAIELALVYSLSYVILAAICGFLFSSSIIGLFSGDRNLLLITSHGLKIMLMSTVFLPFTIIGTVLVQGVGNVKGSIILNLSRQLIFLLPLLFILPGFMGMEGIYYAHILAEIFAAVLALFIMIRYFMKTTAAHPTSS